ncbi:hypothetical protein F2Q69_00027565 [Brassica cretica]|uniref:Uncharacterized protein n=1 Tax=Brassica cretica TaxID=69181 RepID=A0A8S9S1W3_BRACR|nr:hypothetical protein F2Q69_00027565 [Brassica cretica]
MGLRGSNRELALLGRRIPFAGRFSELMEFYSKRLGFPVVAFGFYAPRFFPYMCIAIGSSISLDGSGGDWCLSRALAWCSASSPSAWSNQTDRSGRYRINPRTTGLELQPDPRPDHRTDRTEARLSRATRQPKADGQARINLGRANSDPDHSYSLLARLPRTTCTGDCTDDLSSLVDQIMDFSFGYFSKARILKLSKDLGYVETQLVRSERPATLADSPVHVLIISPLDSASSDASGQEPNGHFD